MQSQWCKGIGVKAFGIGISSVEQAPSIQKKTVPQSIDITVACRLLLSSHLAMEIMSACPSARTLSAVSGMLILFVVIKGRDTCPSPDTKNTAAQDTSQPFGHPWMVLCTGILPCITYLIKLVLPSVQLHSTTLVHITQYTVQALSRYPVRVVCTAPYSATDTGLHCVLVLRCT